MELDTLARELVEKEGSDLHLKVGQPPVFRIYGKLVRSEHDVLTEEGTKQLIYGILNEDQIRRYEENFELDLAYTLEGVARFRVNVFRQQDKVGVVLRAIPSEVKTLEELGLPGVLEQIASVPRGFVLVTGPTGSGKSTTLAAVVDHINRTKRGHVITIEEPIEFWHEDKLCSITQREVPHDSLSFANSLKHAMRQNPDVILVGEMRDIETISLAVTAAETGSLVFSTLHTIDAAQTVDRMIDAFEPDRQAQVRMQLSTSLQAVVSQQLLSRADGAGRVGAFEIMIGTPAIRALIRQGRTDQLYTHIQSGGDIGSQTLDSCLMNLVKDGTVTFEEAVLKSSNPTDFRALLEVAASKSEASGDAPADLPVA